MGDRIQKIAGIIFALAFVGILAMMNQQVMLFGSDVNQQVHNTSTVSVDYELEPFNGTVVSGDTVISAIKNRNSLTSSNLSIQVENDEGVITYSDEAGDETSYDKSRFEIVITDKYTAELAANANGVVTQIVFKLAS